MLKDFDERDALVIINIGCLHNFLSFVKSAFN